MGKKFKVLKDIGDIAEGGAVYHPEGFTTMLMHKLPKYFMEIKTGSFDKKYEYAGEVRPPERNEWFVDTDNNKSYIATWNDGIPRNILVRRVEIKPSSAKQEIITALDESIEHWFDILKMVVNEKKDLPLGGDHCPLCRLFDAPDRGCSECPLGSCTDNSLYEKFCRNRTPKNALAMIEHLQKCRDELTELTVSDVGCLKT